MSHDHYWHEHRQLLPSFVGATAHELFITFFLLLNGAIMSDTRSCFSDSKECAFTSEDRSVDADGGSCWYGPLQWGTTTRCILIGLTAITLWLAYPSYDSALNESVSNFRSLFCISSIPSPARSEYPSSYSVPHAVPKLMRKTGALLEADVNAQALFSGTICLPSAPTGLG